MAQHLDTNLQYEIKVKYPKKYKVLLLNDDYTSMEFVIDVLISIFHKSHVQAQTIMLEIHEQTKGICGIYTHEIAETKIMQVHKKARDSGFPLRATMEEE